MHLTRRDRWIFGTYAIAFLVVGAANYAGLPPPMVFVLATVALAGGALAVGEATEKLSTHLSPSTTGVVQGLLGNLPELFLSIFALQAGLVSVVAAALVGSVLGNVLFVLGVAFLAGGFRHGVLRFAGEANRLLAGATPRARTRRPLPTSQRPKVGGRPCTGRSRCSDRHRCPGARVTGRRIAPACHAQPLVLI